MTAAMFFRRTRFVLFAKIFTGILSGINRLKSKSDERRTTANTTAE